MSLLGLIVLFMVVRPLVRRIVTPEGVAAGGCAGAVGAGGVAGAIGGRHRSAPAAADHAVPAA